VLAAAGSAGALISESASSITTVIVNLQPRSRDIQTPLILSQSTAFIRQLVNHRMADEGSSGVPDTVTTWRVQTGHDEASTISATAPKGPKGEVCVSLEGDSPSLTPREVIERRVRSGSISAEEVDHARAVWRTSGLSDGTIAPFGQRVIVNESDLEHIVLDSRVRRKPERILAVIKHVVELRTAKFGRRMGLSQWDEDGRAMYGFVILEPDGRTRTLKIIDERGFRKLARRGTRIWPNDI